MLRIGFDFFAQAADVHVHAARGDEALGAPDSIEQLIASEDAIGTRREEIEQAKFERAHGYGLAGAGDAVSGGVNAQGANFYGLFRGSARLGAAEQSFHARNEFARAERFGDVIVGAELEAHDAIGFFALGGENQNRYAVERDFLADFLADFQAGKFRQHQVEHQEIRRGFADLRKACGAIPAGGDLVTVFFQVIAHQLYDVFVVFDNQNTFH